MPILKAVRPFVEAGAALHWLYPREKSPVGKGWQIAPVLTYDQMRATYQDGYNIGVRLGEPSKIGENYLQGLDIDVRDPKLAKEAHSEALKLIPEAATLPTVISGSGGYSRHLYFVTDKPFNSRKLLHSKESLVGADGKKHWLWEIELFGTGKQMVIPPSIHPNGKPYLWKNPWREHFIPSETVAAWGASTSGIDDLLGEDPLRTIVNMKPLTDLPIEDIKGTLADLPLDKWCEDRDGWLNVGMALNHQFEGSAEGYDLWCKFSKQSKKFEPVEQKKSWESFGTKPRPVTFRTLIAAVAEIRRDKTYDFGDNPDWRKLLDVSQEGLIKSTPGNLALILQHDPRLAGCLEFNEFAQEPVSRKPIGKLSPGMTAIPVKDKRNGDLLQPIHDHSLRTFLETSRAKGKNGYGLKVTERDFKAGIEQAARARPFHPIKEYLASVEWDGTPRLETAFIRYLGAEDTAYVRAVTRLTFLGAVTRVFEPGHKFDFVPILEGMQGKRKSTFIELTGNRWFAELEGNLDDRKRLVEKMQGAWILEIPELEGFSKSEVQAIKSFVSTREDKVRLAWDARARVFKRQCIFIGSTNEEEYLKDHTGGRRFWPIRCTVEEIDTEAYAKELPQLWAEALFIYRAMRVEQPHGTLPLYLADKDVKAEATEVQESRRVETAEDALAAQIGQWLDTPVSIDTIERGIQEFESGFDLMLRNQTCLSEVWVDCLCRELRHYDSRAGWLLAAAMRRLKGWTRGRVLTHPRFGRLRHYRRNGTEGRPTRVERHLLGLEPDAASKPLLDPKSSAVVPQSDGADRVVGPLGKDQIGASLGRKVTLADELRHKRDPRAVEELSDAEIEEWLAIRKEAAKLIDPETAEHQLCWVHEFDPYEVYPDLPDYYRQVGWEHFARAPGSDIWVSFDDLPKAVRDAFQEKFRQRSGAEPDISYLFES